MVCPKCQFAGWKLASLVHREGRTESDGWAVGVGGVLGTDDSVMPAMGGGVLSQMSQTELSKLAAPPTRGPSPATIRFESNSPIISRYRDAALKLLIGVFLCSICLEIVSHSQTTLREAGRELTWLSYLGVVGLMVAGFVFLWLGIRRAVSRMVEDLNDPNRQVVRQRNMQIRAAHDGRYQQALREYERTRMCARCGTFYLEGEGEVKPNRIIC
jgi:hypothetical protein